MTLPRPRSIAEMSRIDENFVSDESYRRGLAYHPDPTDIFISPYSKCGTTWMQQIVHGLRTRGSMDFEEVSAVVPWLELAHDMEIDVAAAQVAIPKAFKSHLRWDEIPKGGKYIVVLRDPVDAMVSLFKFLEGWHFETGSIAIEDFATYFLTRPDSNNYWSHAASWWRQRDRNDVMLVAFEHMKRDLRPIVEAVADFMGLPPDTELRDLATRQASFEFMKARGPQFDDHLLRQYRDGPCGLPPGARATKVATGQVGSSKPLVSDEIRNAFKARWHATMTQEFGLESYERVLEVLDAGGAR